MRYKKPATILVVNCGSSSLKYRVIEMPGEKELGGGEAVRVGIRASEPPAIHHRVGGEKRTLVTPMPDHAAAFRAVTSLLAGEAKDRPELAYDCFAHRYVHPGTCFTRTARIDRKILAGLKKTLSLAPIHNVVSLNLIEVCSREFTKIPQYAVFDTAFHRTIPAEYASYALPEALVRKYRLRRIGFHGISHRYVMEEACRFLGRETTTQKIISCHLGSGGSSICAIKNGVSVNNSMGFTPLEGLMMNTRCGDLDISVLFHMMANNNLSPEEAEKVLNYKSGILGVFSASSDMRDAAKRSSSDKRAKMACEMYVRRVKKYVGYYALLLKKADILIFTDTLGVELPALRRSVCEGLECFGIRIDEAKNGTGEYRNTDLTGAGSQTRVLVVPTNEEIMIARETYEEFCHDHRG
ncbi:MAG: acetate/propionate family kinase [Endomicrobiales bacterium]